MGSVLACWQSVLPSGGYFSALVMPTGGGSLWLGDRLYVLEPSKALASWTNNSLIQCQESSFDPFACFD